MKVFSIYEHFMSRERLSGILRFIHVWENFIEADSYTMASYK